MTGKRRTSLIILLGSLTTIGPFSIDMYLPGFSSIARDFHTSVSSIGYSLTSYFIGIAVGQLAYGPLTDRFGRKAPLTAGLAIYVAAAVGCALSASVAWLVVARFTMALGASVGMVGSRAVVRDVFPVHEIAGIFSTFMLVIAVSPILAPSLGGYLAAGPGWRFIFVVLGAFAVILLVVVTFALKETREPDPDLSLHPREIVRGYVAVGTNRTFITFAVASGLGMASLFGYISGAPVLFMHRFGMSQTEFGWVFALNASGLIIGSQINRLALRKLSPARVSLVAVTVQLVAGLGLASAAVSGLPSPVPIIAFIMVYMFCSGFINPNTAALALEPFSRNAGSAAALLGSIQMGVGAISSGVVSMFAGDTGNSATLVMLVGAVAAFTILALARPERGRRIAQATSKLETE